MSGSLRFIRRAWGDPDGHAAGWLWASADDFPEWEVLFRISSRDGYAIVSELRVIPAGKGLRYGYEPTVPLPSGGVPGRLLRRISFQAALDEWREGFTVEDWRRDDDPHRLTVETLARQGVGRGDFQPLPSPGRRGHPDLYYARIAQLYVSAIAAGSRSPIRDVSQQLPEWQPEAYVRDAIYKARNERGLLTPAPKGRAGGQLTSKAVQLLSESEAQQ